LKIVGDVAEGSVFLRSSSTLINQMFHTREMNAAIMSIKGLTFVCGLEKTRNAQFMTIDLNVALTSQPMTRQITLMGINAHSKDQMGPYEARMSRCEFLRYGCRGLA